MYGVSDLYKYKEILKNPLHHKETKIDISGVEYGEENIISASIPFVGLYESFGIGNCVSRELDLEIIPIGEIPKQAQIKISQRLVFESDVSEWIPQGVFFISTRKKDKVTGNLVITAFDAMLKAEEIWVNSDYYLENWPLSQESAVNDIAHRMDVGIDERTSLSDSFPVDYPVDENGDLTMREVLSGIAVSNAGNWVISNEGNLLLIGAVDIPAETSYLVNESGSPITFGGVRIIA